MKPLHPSATPVVQTITTSGVLRIVSEQPLKLAPGQRVTMQVQSKGNGIYTLSDGNRSITVEGLPSTISNGTSITLSYNGMGGKTLRWQLSSAPQKAVAAPLFTTIANQTADTKPLPVTILGEQPLKPQKNNQGEQTRHNDPYNGKQKTAVLPTLNNGTKLTGKIIAQDRQTMTLQLAVTEQQKQPRAPSLSNYIGTAPLRIITDTIPEKSMGQNITATLHRDDRGTPLLLVAGNTRLHTPIQPEVHLPPILQRMQHKEQAIGLVQQKLADGQIRIGVHGTELLAPPPSGKQVVPINVGDGLLLRMHAPASSSIPTVEIRQHLPNLLPVLQKNIRQWLPDAPPLTRIIDTIRSATPPALSAGSPPPSALHQALESWLQRAHHNDNTPITGARLAAIIRNAGQLLEHKLLQLAQQQPLPSSALAHDLKTVLAKIAASTPSQPQPAPTAPASTAAIDSNTIPKNSPPLSSQQHQALANRAAEAAQQGVHRIESSQLHASIESMHNEPLRIEFPMMVFNQLVTIQMSIMEQQHQQQHRDSSDDNNKLFNILMLLHLSNLGEVRIDSSISRNQVLARIHLDTDGATQFAQQHLHRLTSKMESAGFNQVHITIAQQPPTPSKQQAFSQLTSMVPSSTSLLDLEI